MCFPRWFKRFLFCEKTLSPCLHNYGFVLTCILRCNISSLYIVKALKHWLHWYGFSIVCVLWWFMKLLLSQKLLLYLCYLYYISPVCVLRWFIWFIFYERVLPQWLHWYGFPQYILSWKSLITLVALVWFINSMCPHMNCQLTIVWISLSH